MEIKEYLNGLANARLIFDMPQWLIFLFGMSPAFIAHKTVLPAIYLKVAHDRRYKADRNLSCVGWQSSRTGIEPLFSFFVKLLMSRCVYRVKKQRPTPRMIPRTGRAPRMHRNDLQYMRHNSDGVEKVRLLPEQ